nr:hypothetical protein KXZ65_08530 [Pectobacterium sp. PL152]
MPASSPSLRFYLVIGLLQGLLFVAVQEMKSGILQTMLITMAAVGGISLQLLERTLLVNKTWLWAGALTVLMTAISGWVLYDGGETTCLIPGYCVASYSVISAALSCAVGQHVKGDGHPIKHSVKMPGAIFLLY